MDADQKVRAWLERELGGTVVAFDRQPRWRPAWFADVSRDGRLHRYYVRGSRGGNFLEMITLAQEADVNRVLLKHGVPVPAVHGMIDDPPAIVMDRLPGRANLATAVDDAERDAVLDAVHRGHAADARDRCAGVRRHRPAGARRQPRRRAEPVRDRRGELTAGRSRRRAR